MKKAGVMNLLVCKTCNHPIPEKEGKNYADKDLPKTECPKCGKQGLTFIHIVEREQEHSIRDFDRIPKEIFE